MTRKISPIVAEATARAGITSHYRKLFSNLGVIGNYITPDDYNIDKYVTEKTIDGIFHMIAVEEKQIRRSPVARTTSLLKRVFGEHWSARTREALYGARQFFSRPFKTVVNHLCYCSVQCHLKFLFSLLRHHSSL